MSNWERSKAMIIQPHHDLETMFISFAALCVWFQLPYCAKEQGTSSGFDWMFEPHKDKDPGAVYRKWQRFRPHFESSILHNLSPYFKCPAIVDLLTTMRDMCIPLSWEGEPSDPAGYRWQDDVKRATHKDMLDAVEKAILTLLKEGNEDRLHRQDLVEDWIKAHAHITDDGIFSPPPAMTQDFPPIVVDGTNSPRGLVMSGIFDQVRPVKPDKRSAPSYSAPLIAQSTMSLSNLQAARTEEKAFQDNLLGGPRPKGPAKRGAPDNFYFQEPKAKSRRWQ
jgi:hypothetical protein